MPPPPTTTTMRVAAVLLLLCLAAITVRPCLAASDLDKLPFLHASYRTGHHAEYSPKGGSGPTLRGGSSKSSKAHAANDALPPSLTTSRRAIIAERYVHKPGTTAGQPYECHASTIVETSADGDFVATWFQGTEENAPDVAVYRSTLRMPRAGESNSSQWTPPRRVVDAVDSSPVTCGRKLETKCKGQMSTWNPALAHLPNGTTLLFYKRGPSPSEWAGYYVRSDDGGKSFGSEQSLPKGITCGAKNAPIVVWHDLPSADRNAWSLLCGASTEEYGKATATGGRERKWQLFVDAYDNRASSWTRYGPVPYDGNAIQPSLFVHPETQLLALVARSATDYDIRTQRKVDPHRDPKNRKRMIYQGKKYAVMAVSENRVGSVWVKPARAIAVPCPNSGLDATMLPDGRLVVVHNDWDPRSRSDNSVKSDDAYSRSRLVVSVSGTRNLDSWRVACVLEDATKTKLQQGQSMGPEFSYPSVSLGRSSGLLHVTYTYDRKGIKHATLDPRAL